MKNTKLLVFGVIISLVCCSWFQYGYDERESFQSVYKSKNGPSSWSLKLPYVDHRARILLDDKRAKMWVYTAKETGENIANYIDLETQKVLFSVPVPSQHHSKKYISLLNDGQLVFYASAFPGVLTNVDGSGKVGGWNFNTSFTEVMNVATQSNADGDFVLYQSPEDAIQSVKFGSSELEWKYSTGSSQGNGPFTFLEDQLVFATNGPPYYFIVLDPQTGEELKKVEWKSSSEITENAGNVHMYPKITVSTVLERYFYIENRGKEGSFTSVLYALDFDFERKWSVNFTAAQIMKCVDPVISQDGRRGVSVCWKELGEDNYTSIVNILDISEGKIEHSFPEVSGQCDKVSLNDYRSESEQSSSKALFYVRCPSAIFEVGMSSLIGKTDEYKMDQIVEGDVVYEILTDADECLYYVVGDNKQQVVTLNCRCKP